MAKVDVHAWKEFRLIGPDGLFSSYERGKISVARELSEGETPYIGAVFPDRNNGVVKYVTPSSNNQITKGNCIVMVCDGAAIGCNMYQESDFVGTVNLKIVRADFMNRNIGLFLCAALNRSAVRCGYSYFQKRNDEALCKEMISLPSTLDGQPDWAYMDVYMSEVLKKEEVFAEHLASLTAEAVADGHKLDTSGWKAFRIGELFDIRPTRAYKWTNSELLVATGNVPVVANSAQNNGVVGFSDLPATENGGIITFSDTTDANAIFYQAQPFIGYAHVQGMYPKFQKISDFGMLFLVSAFQSQALRMNFDYANKFRRDIALNIEIYLPVTQAGEPDWAWMEQYMQQQMDKAEALVEHLDAVWN